MSDSSRARHGHIPLVESTRGAIVESVHYGSLAVVSAAGTPILSAGAPNAPVYARSALKPLQLVAMVRAGLDLPDELLALGASSHSGAAAHQAGAERIRFAGRPATDRTTIKMARRTGAVVKNVRRMYSLDLAAG